MKDIDNAISRYLSGGVALEQTIQTAVNVAVHQIVFSVISAEVSRLVESQRERIENLVREAIANPQQDLEI